MARLHFDALNAAIRYLMFSVFAVRPGALGDDRAAVVDETATFLKQQEGNGVVVRGLYDVSGLRADADFMIWTHSERVEALQATYADFRRTTRIGRASTPVWSAVALHRPAEFNKSHIPAFLAGEEPGNYLCVYPFVAAGSILYVVIELLAVARKADLKTITAWGIFAGLILGFATDAILTAAGA